MVDSWSEIEKKMALYQYDYTFIITLYSNKMKSPTQFYFIFHSQIINFIYSFLFDLL